MPTREFPLGETGLSADSCLLFHLIPGLKKGDPLAVKKGWRSANPLFFASEVSSENGGCCAIELLQRSRIALAIYVTHDGGTANRHA